MNTVLNIAQNPYLLAIANICAVITAFVFAFQFMRWCVRLFIPLSSSPVATAFFRIRQSAVRLGYQLARDRSLLIIFCFQRLMNVIVLLFMITILSTSNVATPEQFKLSYTLSKLHSNYGSYLSFVALTGLLNKIAVTFTFGFIFAQLVVLRYGLIYAKAFRYRLYAKRRLPWTEVGEALPK